MTRQIVLDGQQHVGLVSQCVGLVVVVGEVCLCVRLVVVGELCQCVGLVVEGDQMCQCVGRVV